MSNKPIKDEVVSEKLSVPSQPYVVTFMCSNCSTLIPYSKLDHLKCKVCNNRIFYKCRNPNQPSLYIAK